MPRKPIDHSKTIIYKLCCKDPNIKLTYVGATTNFPNRKGEHKSCCNNHKSKKNNLKVYRTIRENGGWDNFEMIMLEKYPCKDQIESDARERYWLEKLSASLNTEVPGRTKSEYNKKWWAENTEKMRLRKQERYKNNLEKFNRKYTCECGVTLILRIKTVHEKTKQHQHWLKTGEHKVVKGEQYTCGCGVTLTKTKKKRHETSKGHQKWLASSSSKNDKNEK